MNQHTGIALEPGLSNGEVGSLVDIELIATRHPDGIALSADQWASLREQRQHAGRPVHWWEVACHG